MFINTLEFAMPKQATRWGLDDAFRVEEAKARTRRRRKNRALWDGKKANVIDRSGSAAHLERAAKSLKTQPAHKRVLSAPQWDMDKAVEAMKRAGVTGIVSNLCGSRKVRVR
jgi:hypothetical protein